MPPPLAELTAHAQSLTSAGDLVGARAVLADVLDPTDADPRRATADLAIAAALLARILIALGDPHTARVWAGFAHAAEERLHGPHDERTIAAAATHAAVLQRTGNHGRAVQLYHDLVGALITLDGPDSSRVLAAQADLATAEHSAGQCTAARSRLADAWTRHRAEHGDTAPAGIKMLARLSAMERDCGLAAAAQDHLGLARELCARHLPADHPLARQVGALTHRPGGHQCGRVAQSVGPSGPLLAGPPDPARFPQRPGGPLLDGPGVVPGGPSPGVATVPGTVPAVTALSPPDGPAGRHTLTDLPAPSWPGRSSDRPPGPPEAAATTPPALSELTSFDPPRFRRPTVASPPADPPRFVPPVPDQPPTAFAPRPPTVAPPPADPPRFVPLPPASPAPAAAPGAGPFPGPGASPAAGPFPGPGASPTAGPFADPSTPPATEAFPDPGAGPGGRPAPAGWRPAVVYPPPHPEPVRIPPPPHATAGATTVTGPGTSLVADRRLPVPIARPGPARSRRWMALAAVLVAGIAVAGVVVAAALPRAARDAPAGSAAGPAAATPAATASPAAPSAPGGAPENVRLRDNRDSVSLQWGYPAGAEGPVLISGGRTGQEQRAFQQLPAGTTNYVVYGLNERENYCFTVAVVYTVDHVAASPQVCTQRR
ncbi:hypothetical protein [Krasilnikovia sp. MM14-A1259]|uniref:hypothetical protein n=1 Tax=Krasilnikovia sp. MM14-A1259 TaxID=3373539 RepID=UPI00399D07BA